MRHRESSAFVTSSRPPPELRLRPAAPRRLLTVSRRLASGQLSRPSPPSRVSRPLPPGDVLPPFAFELVLGAEAADQVVTAAGPDLVCLHGSRDHVDVLGAHRRLTFDRRDFDGLSAALPQRSELQLERADVVGCALRRSLCGRGFGDAGPVTDDRSRKPRPCSTGRLGPGSPEPKRQGRSRRSRSPPGSSSPPRGTRRSYAPPGRRCRLP